jgi:hypothetical protein
LFSVVVRQLPVVGRVNGFHRDHVAADLTAESNRRDGSHRDAHLVVASESLGGCTDELVRVAQSVNATVQQQELRRMRDASNHSITGLAEVFSVSRPTVYRTPQAGEAGLRDVTLALGDALVNRSPRRSSACQVMCSVNAAKDSGPSPATCARLPSDRAGRDV